MKNVDANVRANATIKDVGVQEETEDTFEKSLLGGSCSRAESQRRKEINGKISEYGGFIGKVIFVEGIRSG